CHKLRSKSCVSLGVHRPEHCSSVVPGECVRRRHDELAPELNTGKRCAVNLDDVCIRQILPCRSVRGISCRLFVLRQSGHDTERHVCGRSFTIEDCFVLCKTDCLGQHLDDP